MDPWLVIALVAYSMGATIEGVHAACQLAADTTVNLPSITVHDADDTSLRPHRWQIVLAIATVSLCAACFWPFRLLHRSIKQLYH